MLSAFPYIAAQCAMYQKDKDMSKRNWRRVQSTNLPNQARHWREPEVVILDGDLSFEVPAGRRELLALGVASEWNHLRLDD